MSLFSKSFGPTTTRTPLSLSISPYPGALPYRRQELHTLGGPVPPGEIGTFRFVATEECAVGIDALPLVAAGRGTLLGITLAAHELLMGAVQIGAVAEETPQESRERYIRDYRAAFDAAATHVTLVSMWDLAKGVVREHNYYVQMQKDLAKEAVGPEPASGSGSDLGARPLRLLAGEALVMRVQNPGTGVLHVALHYTLIREETP